MPKNKPPRQWEQWEKEFVKDCVEKGWACKDIAPHLPHRSFQSIYALAVKYGYIGLKKRKALERGKTLYIKTKKPDIVKNSVYDIHLYWVKAGYGAPSEHPEPFRYIRRTRGFNNLNIFEHIEGKWKLALTDYETNEALKNGVIKKKW